MIKIAIIGSEGYIGSSLNELFKDHAEIIGYDIKNNTSSQEVNNCKIAFVAVPTPPDESGKCDISIVEECVSWIETEIIVIKSTVIPGTTEYLSKKYKKRIVFCPEFFGTSKYYIPKEIGGLKEWPFYVFGGSKTDIEPVLKFYQQVGGPTKKYLQTNSKTAEMLKYVDNSFFATKIIFFNEVYNICRKAGVNYNELRELLLNDKRINSMHTIVNTENGKSKGFGGHCLPKDIQALSELSKELGVNSEFLKQVIKTNKKYGN